MWLRHPYDATKADDVRDYQSIQRQLAEGWTEVLPLWLRHATTGVVLLVTHPEHQRRLLLEGATPVPAPVAEAEVVEAAAPRPGKK